MNGQDEGTLSKEQSLLAGFATLLKQHSAQVIDELTRREIPRSKALEPRTYGDFTQGNRAYTLDGVLLRKPGSTLVGDLAEHLRDALDELKSADAQLAAIRASNVVAPEKTPPAGEATERVWYKLDTYSDRALIASFLPLETERERAQFFAELREDITNRACSAWREWYYKHSTRFRLSEIAITDDDRRYSVECQLADLLTWREWYDAAAPIYGLPKDAQSHADRQQHTELRLQEIIGWEVWARKTIGRTLGDTTSGEACRKQIDIRIAELQPWSAWAHALVGELGLTYLGKSTSGVVADKVLRDDLRVLAKIGKNWRDNEVMQPGLAPKSELEAVPLPEGQKPAVRRAWQCIHCLAYMQHDAVTAHVCETSDSDPGVHYAHCCQVHGCKYGDADCPVANIRCAECELSPEESDSGKSAVLQTLLMLTRIFAVELEREQASTPPKSNSPMMPVLVKLHSMLLRACNEISRRPT